MHTITLSEDGECFVWGFNLFGQLGVGDTQDRNKPPIVDNGKYNRFINIFCGYNHNIGITENGDCYGWGSSGSGQLGLDDYENYSTPKRLKEAPLSTVNQVQQQQRYIWFSCGTFHTVALTNLGIVVFISTTVNLTIQFMM